MTFDTYAERAWSPALDQRHFQPFHPPAPNSGGARNGTARVVRLDDANGLLFAPLHSAAVLPEENHALEWAAASDGPLRTQITDTDPLTYDIAPGRGDAPQGIF